MGWASSTRSDWGQKVGSLPLLASNSRFSPSVSLHVGGFNGVIDCTMRKEDSGVGGKTFPFVDLCEGQRC